MLKYSSIVSIIYFSVNIIFLTILAIVVYKQGQHKLKSKSYVKDVWSQRKIYAPLIVHFYDTATDIGVIYNWFELMESEQNGTYDYESVNMTIFFWTGIAFLAVYRIGTFIFVVYDIWDGGGDWYDLILVFFDLYIFKMVYESFSEAQDIITDNTEKRQRNEEKKRKKREEAMKKQMEIEIEMAEKTKTTTNEQPEEAEEIEPVERQLMVQLGESVSESMPQIVLQSVFIIRSANDPDLEAAGSNIYLLLFSIIASLFSIAGKMTIFDKDEVEEKAKSLKPRQQFPHCIQYWYIVRIIWRMSHVMSRFGVFVLIWTVMGGAWLPIWAGLSWIFWTVVTWMDSGENGCGAVLQGMLIALIFMVGVLNIEVKLFVCKFIETFIGLTLITVFATLMFDCGICADPFSRQLFDNRNKRILIFWLLTLGSSISDMILFVVMYRYNVFN